MNPDLSQWAFVAAAYGLVIAVLVAYWRRLEHRLREVEAATGAGPEERESR